MERMTLYLVNIAKCALDFAANCDCEVNRIELKGMMLRIDYIFCPDMKIIKGVKLHVENNGVLEEYDYCNSTLKKI